MGDFTAALSDGLNLNNLGFVTKVRTAPGISAALAQAFAQAKNSRERSKSRVSDNYEKSKSAIIGAWSEGASHERGARAISILVCLLPSGWVTQI